MTELERNLRFSLQYIWTCFLIVPKTGPFLKSMTIYTWNSNYEIIFFLVSVERQTLMYFWSHFESICEQNIIFNWKWDQKWAISYHFGGSNLLSLTKKCHIFIFISVGDSGSGIQFFENVRSNVSYQIPQLLVIGSQIEQVIISSCRFSYLGQKKQFFINETFILEKLHRVDPINSEKLYLAS